MSILLASILMLGASSSSAVPLPATCTSPAYECTKILQRPQLFTGSGVYSTPPDPSAFPSPFNYANFDSESDLLANRYAETNNLAVATAPPYRAFCWMSTSSPGDSHGNFTTWSPPNVADQFGYLPATVSRDYTFTWYDEYLGSQTCPGEFHTEVIQENGLTLQYCPNGWSPSSDPNIGPYCYRPKCVRCQKNLGINTSFGNPINLLEDIKLQTELDYTTNGLLRVQREYRSDGFAFAPGAGAPPNAFGGYWRSSYDRQIVEATDSNSAYVAQLDRPDGTQFYFTEGANGYVGGSAHPGTLKRLLDAQNNPIGWTYESDANEIETYNANGILTNIATRDGRNVTLTHDSSNHVLSVTDERGRVLQFNYDPRDGYPGQMRVSSVTLPDGNTVSYEYNYANLIAVAHLPGGTTRQYGYADPNSIVLLTSITDENGATYATFTYDANHHPTSTQHAGGVDNYAMVSGQIAYTDPLGAQHTFAMSVVSNAYRFTSETKTCSGCPTTTQTVHYDSLGNVDYGIDFNSNKTTYTYDPTIFVETSRTEASGTSLARTTNTIWDANFRVPDSRSIVNASNTTEALTNWAYNSRGQVLSRCEVDPTVSAAVAYTCGSSTNAPSGVRQTSYTYCEQAGVTAGTCPLVGQVLSVTGPRTDVSSVTTYTYYLTTDVSGCATTGGSCHYLGDLYQVSNALGQTTTYVSYDQNGRVTRQSDANGTLTDLTYSPRGWLLTRTVRANADGSASSNDATTTFAYDNVGNVTRITQPDGAYLSYTYDAAHRLTGIADNQSNTITYTLDAAGNRTGEATTDPSNTLKRSLSRQYDQLSHLTQTLNAANSAAQTYQNPAEAAPSGITYTNGYDGNGNAVYSVDGNGVGSEQQYDPLNRLTKTLQDHAGTGATKDTTTQYAYDARDNLRSVSDPDGLVTTYTYDGLNNLTQLQSPDTASSSYTYDAAGNRLTQTDARGTTTTYTYDALNRLTGIGYPTSTLNVTYRYDQANSVTGCATSYPTGRLTTITDSSGSTVYCYDRRGNVLSKQQTANGVVSTMSTAYTLADRIQNITYPSGATVSYTRNTLGQITAITYQSSATASAQTLISSTSYLPFGPLSQITFGNGRTLSKSYDQNYAISQVVSSDPNGLIVGASVDVLGNLTSASSTIGANPPTQSYLYDPLYRLTTSQTGATPPSPLESYTYGKTGDRTSAALNGNTATSYAYNTGTHQLQAVGTATRSYDANGNTLSANGNTFTYDDRNRLSALNAGSPTATQATYSYNGKGERVAKLVGTGGQLETATTFVYGEGGQLIGEYTGGNSQEYLYLDGVPVGVVTAIPQTGGGTTNQMYYVETDQLGTPRAMVQPGATTSADTIVWKWDYFGSGAAFGMNAPSIQTLTVNLRFDGQYYDAETGLVHNGFRDYGSNDGRYLQPDPIGLDGGINPYTYVNDRPLTKTDPQGLILLSDFFDPDTQAQMFNAANRVEKLLNSPCDCGGKSCYPCELRDELLRKFYTTEIQFNPSRISTYKGQQYHVCATTPLHGSIISITNNGLAEGHGGCQCLSGLMFHELLHAVGIDHTTNNKSDPNDPVWGPEMKCNLCSGHPLPWEVF